jgi:hypothetical protein
MRRPNTTLKLSKVGTDLLRVEACDVPTGTLVTLWHGPIENLVSFEWAMAKVEHELEVYLEELQLA